MTFKLVKMIGRKQSTWEELQRKADLYNKLSKPEALIIIGILFESETSLTISQIYDKFIENYHNNITITRRQISYCMDLLEESNIIENGSLSDKEKKYSLLDIREKIKVQLSVFQGIILGISAAIFVIFQNQFMFGVLMGEIVFVLTIQIEAAFFAWRNKNIYIKYI